MLFRCATTAAHPDSNPCFLPDQAVQQEPGLRQEHAGGERRQQRHPQAAKRPPGARKALQVVRHEEVSAERQQRDEEDLP